MMQPSSPTSPQAVPSPGEVVEAPAFIGTAEDEEEPYEHDQLPSVEEVRSRASMFLAESDRVQRNTRRILRSPPDVFKILFWIGVLLLLAALIILIVGLTAGRGGSSSRVVLTQLEVEQYLIDNGYAEAESLRDQASPQFLAAQWLVTSDGRGAVPLEQSVLFLQRYVICVLYFTTNGLDWTNRWNLLEKDRPTCAWNSPARSDDGRSFTLGATCRGNQVHRIQIPQSNLVGPLPKELGLLTSLVFVALHHNALTGVIPTEWRALTNMDYLALHWNKLEGTVPSWFDEWPKLRVLGLGDNNYVGSIPSSLAKLTNLVTLGLDNNDMTGDLQHLQDLNMMKRLYLNSNTFTGSLGSVYLKAMRNLEELDLSENSFTGTVPIDMFQYPQLKILDLNTNMLSGDLPLGSYDNKVLTYVALHANALMGPILESMASMINLTHLDFSDNAFTGNIPPKLTESLTNLRYLFFSEIPTLEPGPVPDMTALTELRDVSFKSSRRTGTIPNFCQSAQLLQLYDLDGNDLTGTIPEKIGLDCEQLQYLFLNRNEQLGGTVPTGIQNLPHLSKCNTRVLLGRSILCAHSRRRAC